MSKNEKTERRYKVLTDMGIKIDKDVYERFMVEASTPEDALFYLTMFVLPPDTQTSMLSNIQEYGDDDVSVSMRLHYDVIDVDVIIDDTEKIIKYEFDGGVRMREGGEFTWEDVARIAKLTIVELNREAVYLNRMEFAVAKIYTRIMRDHYKEKNDSSNG